MVVSPVVATVIVFGLAILLVALGLPIAFALGSAALVSALLLWGPGSLAVAYTALIGNALEFVLVAIPLFIFMGVALERAGVAEALYATIYQWTAGLRGGLAAGTIVISTLMAAMTGISGAACVSMGIIALPSMLHRGYDKKLAMGSIMGGAALGTLIPPSVNMVVLALFANVSVGRLFAGGIFPGLVISSLFIVYILIRSALRPGEAPALAKEERVGWGKRVIGLRGVILPIIIIVSVLGTIFAGIATPTEAAGIGAIGTLLCAVINRTFNWKFVRESANRTLRISAMCMWLIFGAAAFAAVYTAVGGPELVKQLLVTMQVNRWVVFALMQLSFLFFGCFIDPLGIIMITMPIYLPLLKFLQFEKVWYLIVFCVNMEMAYLTPPFGWNLFYMKGVAPEGITMMDVYRAVIPFVLIQALGLVLVIVFPAIATWFPTIIFG